MSDEYPFQFEAKVVLHPIGSFQFHAVYLPHDLVQRLPLQGRSRLRISGELDEIRIDAAIMPSKGQWYIMTSKKLLRICGIQVGDVTRVQFDIADQDAVTVPPELRHELDADESALEKWEQLTPGKRRGLAYQIESARRAETRERRVAYIIEQLKAKA